MGPSRAPNIPRLASEIREVAGATEALPNALDVLRSTLGFGGAGALIVNKATRSVEWTYFFGLSDETEARYLRHYAIIDPFLPLLRETPGWMQLSERYPRSILARNEWYNDFVVGFCGVGDIIAARVADTPTRSVFIGVYQEIGARFSDKSLSQLGQLTSSLGALAQGHVERLYGVEREENGALISPLGSRYYFHLGKGRVYRDDAGVVLPTRDAALANAARMAAELAEDQTWHNFSITITDERAKEIARVPVRP
ncbi:MAG TPA: hypothetical protein VK934_09435 [Fimbriimonas sp.]|nr:hypothetical protein [Fimbriimonas sp.]